METVAGVAWQVLKQLVFSFVFFWPGWVVVKMATFGRYPRSIHPAKADWIDYEFVSFIGIVAVTGAVLLVTRVWP